ncbi:MAG TPA: choice-of-anchor L domain-containing protein, partial [Candidatus Goldiibacteriota bacterium]|nr:choice-of-anchor L domain-containing protein [Candidatus Goldiibacteriota bacterium]
MKKFFLPVALFFFSLNTYAFFISDTINAPYLVSSFLVADTGITTTNVSINYSLEGGVASGIYYDGPLGIANGIILTTGLAQSAMPPNDSPNTSTNLGMPGNSTLVNAIVGASVESFDTIILTIKFNVDADIHSIVFDLIFGSEEYPEYVGSKFNDCFGVFLNDTQIVFDQFGKPITINGPFFGSKYVKTPPENGLEYDGSTDVLVCKAPITPGSTNNVLKFVISDVGDANYDSGALLARLRGSVDIV